MFVTDIKRVSVSADGNSVHVQATDDAGNPQYFAMEWSEATKLAEAIKDWSVISGARRSHAMGLDVPEYAGIS